MAHVQPVSSPAPSFHPWIADTSATAHITPDITALHLPQTLQWSGSSATW